MTAAGRIYRLLLRAMPRSFREVYGREAVEAYVQRIRTVAAAHGPVRGKLAALAGLWDLLHQIPREWLDVVRDHAGRRGESPRAERAGALHGLGRDLRHGGRSLLRAWPLSVAVILTLSLGIGANSAIFSVVDAVLLRPLDYPGAERIMTLGEVNPGITIEPRWTSPANFVDWRDGAGSFERMALFRGRSMSVTGDGEALYAYGCWVSSDFFRAFATEPLLGRDLVPEDGDPSADDVVVLSHALWSSRYGADPGIVGSTIQVDGVARTVIAVMPAGFTAPSRWIAPGVQIQLWLPFPMDTAAPQWGRDNRSFNVVGRLAEGRDVEAAREEMETLHAGLARAYPAANRDWRPVVTPWRDMLVGDTRRPVLLLLAASVLVLLIACGNVAALMINRLIKRLPEVGMRTALGATRWMIARWVLSEAAILAAAGMIGGLAVAFGATAVFRRLAPGNLPFTDVVRVDGSVLAVTLTAAAAVGLVTGALPAVLGSGVRWTRRLASPGASGGLVRARLRKALAVGQLALAFGVLVSAGLVARSFQALMSAPLGFDPEGVLTATVVLSWDRLTTLDDRSRFVGSTLDELRALPGVTSAGMINSLPLSGSNAWQPFSVEGVPLTDPDRPPAASFRGVSPGYLSTMGIPVVAGRDFGSSDLTEPGVVLVNETFRRNHLPEGDPIGRVVHQVGADRSFTVVGVVGDVRHRGLHMPADPEIYQPYTVETLSSKTFVVRTGQSPALLAAQVREVVQRVDPEQPIRDVRPMTAWVDRAAEASRFNATMLSVSGLVALALSVVGLFGVVSFVVAARRKEFGIRLALGAEDRGILRMVLAQGTVIAALGVGIGAAVAAAGGRVLQGMLFQIEPFDPWTWAGAGALFLVVTLIASWVPARRASNVDPMEAFRT